MMLQTGEFKESEKYYFFPNVVTVDRPPNAWKHLRKSGYQFGWVMECTDGHLSPYFVQLLLLRLMFGSTIIKRLSSAPMDIHSMSTVWKSGIFWSNEEGVDTIVDVIDNSKVLVLMHCCDSLKDRLYCINHRSSLLNAIRGIKQEICSAVDTKEFFIEPNYIDHPIKPDYNQVLAAMEDVIKSISNECNYVYSNCHHKVDIRDIVFFDPYVHLCSTLSSALHNAELSEQAPSPEFLTALSNHLCTYFDLFIELIRPSPALLADIHELRSPFKKFMELLKIWLHRIGNTFKCLKDQLDKLTVFQIDAKLPGM